MKNKNGQLCILMEKQLTVKMVDNCMKKRIILVLVLCICGCLIGCNKSPKSIEVNKQGIAYEDREEITPEKEGKDILSSIPKRFVYEYDSDNEKKNIDIPVNIPKQEPIRGILQQIQLPVQEVCAQLEPEGSWVQNNELAEYTGAEDAYEISVKTDSGTDVIRQLAFYKDKNYIYSNTNGDDALFPVDAQLISEKNWTEKQREYVEKKRLDAEAILKNMGMNFQVTNIQLYEYQEIDYVTFFMSLVINDLTVCDLEGVTSQMQNVVADAEITLSDERISEFRITGNYELDSEENVKLADWEQIESIFKEEIENADWSVYDLTEVKLEYIVKSDMTLLPVWSFYGEVATDIEKPLLCLNACTGKVEFQWGM